LTAGNSSEVTVRVRRSHAPGRITLRVSGLSKGLAVSVLVLGDNQERGKLTVSSDLLVVPGKYEADLSAELSASETGLPQIIPARLVVTVVAPKPGTVTVKNTLDLKMSYIPPGEFSMGAGEGEVEDRVAFRNERLRHRVRITRPFLMSSHEITVGQFRQFVSASGFRVGGNGKGWDARKGYSQRSEFNWANIGWNLPDDYPAVNITHLEALEFCKWLSKKEGVVYDLPTEAEWEYACRAGTTTRYSFGDDPAQVRMHAWYALNPTRGIRDNGPQKVGGKKANAWGLFDMHGNVQEWCKDGLRAYPDRELAEPLDDPAGPLQGLGKRALRGGCVWDDKPEDCRSARRAEASQDTREPYLGFRVVRRLEPLPAR